MKFLPTSSLDKIDPPTPFVHATNWDQFRGQFRSSRTQTSGYRNCSQAANLLNCGTDDWDKSQSCSNGRNPFAISMETESYQLASSDVDTCFGDTSLAFLQEQSVDASNDNGQSVNENLDLELGLLESVQEIAISLARTSARLVEKKLPHSSELSAMDFSVRKY